MGCGKRRDQAGRRGIIERLAEIVLGIYEAKTGRKNNELIITQGDCMGDANIVQRWESRLT